jgi:hypothetical protein
MAEGRRPGDRIVDVAAVPRACGNAARDRQPALARKPTRCSRRRDPRALRYARDLSGRRHAEQAAKFLNDEIARWAKVIKTAGVKADD